METKKKIKPGAQIASAMSVIREIRKGQKRPDGFFGTMMTRPVSPFAAYLFYRLHFSPNMVTFISFLFCCYSCIFLLIFRSGTIIYAIAAVVWWLGAILDAADGDLARYTGTGSAFGGWFDAYLDRLKEFGIFAVFGLLAFKGYGLPMWGGLLDSDFMNELYLYLGFFGMLSNVMSGWVTDTKELFSQGKRKVEIKLSEKYLVGMVDTRDFVVILTLFVGDFRIALYLYGMLFPFALIYQTYRFAKKYG